LSIAPTGYGRRRHPPARVLTAYQAAAFATWSCLSPWSATTPRLSQRR